jgi:hypothetical protein
VAVLLLRDQAGPGGIQANEECADGEPDPLVSGPVVALVRPVGCSVPVAGAARASSPPEGVIAAGQASRTAGNNGRQQGCDQY